MTRKDRKPWHYELGHPKKRTTLSITRQAEQTNFQRRLQQENIAKISTLLATEGTEMDHKKADDDTADEVNILILDYMICMAVHEAISGQVQNWVTWLDGTQRLLETVHPATEILPPHLRTKIRVFEIIGLFIQTEDKPRPELQELTDMATDLVVSSRTTDQKATRDPAVEAAIHIYAHAALRTHRDPDDRLLDDQSIERRREGTPRSMQDIPGYISRILPSLGVPTKTYLEVTGQILRDNGTTAGLFDALARIMMSLEPPVLTQLERGKLNGLSRAQTEELKIRVGMH